MRDLIDITLWRMERLTARSYASDFYYVKLARKLYDIIYFSELGRDQGEDMSLNLAVTVAHYFEDVISGIGVWQTFTSKHKELYGKYLPFYELDETQYYQDEINREDIQLLCWMVIQKAQWYTFINPENPSLEKMACMVYNVLDSEFEKAPMNIHILDDLKDPCYYKDFYALKDMLMRLVNWNYLFIFFTEQRLEGADDKVDALLGEDLKPSQANYAAVSLLACCEKTGPLSLYAKDWLAAILSFHGMTEESERIAAIEFLDLSIYQLKKYDSENLYLADIKGKEYIVPRDSFNELPDSTPRDNKSFIGSLVKYDGVWYVNGLSSWGVGLKLFNSYKRKLSSKACSSVLYDKLMKLTDNHPLIYFKDYQEMNEWLCTHIGPNKKIVSPSLMKDKCFFALYIDKENNICMVPDAALKIKDVHNPYYNQAEAESDAISLIASTGSISDNMLHYLIEHDMLPDACINSLKGPERGKQLVQENIDFLARFMRDSNY